MSSKIEVERRVFTVQAWIIDGVQDYLILKQATTQWGVTLRQAKRYLKSARERWQSDESTTIDQERDDKIARLQQIARSLKDEYKGTPSGIRAIMSVEKEIIKLKGLAVKRIDVTSAGKPLQMSDEDRDARIEELIRKRNAHKK